MPSPLKVNAGFLSFPAELRVKIYNYIIDCIPRAYTDKDVESSSSLWDEFETNYSLWLVRSVPQRIATTHDLKHFQGFILSNKQVNVEFGTEWCKAFNTFLRTELRVGSIVIAPVSRLSNSAHIRVGIKRPEKGWLTWSHNTLVYPIVARFVENLPSFCLYPITDDPAEMQALNLWHITGVDRGKRDDATIEFLPIMKRVAWDVSQAGYHTPRVLVKENYVDIAFDYAWKEVAKKRGWGMYRDM